MQAEIITVGTELLLGETVDLHSSFLSRECVSLGIEVIFHTSVGDDANRLLEVLRFAHARSKLVFLCGGLGPTLDDLTKETLAEFIGMTLVQDPEVTERLERYFSNRGRSMPASNYKQTFVFPGGTVFQNDHGTAPGLAVSHDGVTYVLLPGPPNELIPMFEKSVRPFLLQQFYEKQAIVSQPLSFFGIGESLLEEKIKDLIQQYQNPIIATYAKEAGVVLRLTSKANDEWAAKALIEPVKREILARVGEFCFSEEDQSLEEVLVSTLAGQGKTVSVAESCTGGLLSELLTSVPGSSEVYRGGFVSYSAESKNQIVHVPADVLQKYGTVSSQVAEILAENTRQQFGTDFALSITGVAGPASVENHPVGLVYIGLKEAGAPARVYRFRLRGTRRRIRLMAAKHACFILQQRLKKGETTR
jgi:nicotinamide-nucleotide amidase